MYVWVGVGAWKDSKVKFTGKGFWFNKMLHCAFSKEKNNRNIILSLKLVSFFKVRL